jgi:hypothetical protein
MPYPQLIYTLGSSSRAPACLPAYLNFTRTLYNSLSMLIRSLYILYVVARAHPHVYPLT